MTDCLLVFIFIKIQPVIIHYHTIYRSIIKCALYLAVTGRNSCCALYTCRTHFSVALLARVIVGWMKKCCPVCW